jgi:hypothetical protein
LLLQETVICVEVAMIFTVASGALQRFVQFFPAFPAPPDRRCQYRYATL